MPSFFRWRTGIRQIALEIKVQRTDLIIADSLANAELLSYFCSLLNEPQSMSLQRVMDNNYCFNFRLEQHAELSNRGLSAFKKRFPETI
jgi:hypothetical protein